MIFQFHYGTIKSAVITQIKTGDTYFNSTMVRLKVERAMCFLNQIRFQFHYGTIKSRVAGKVHRHFQAFQFHYGTIKR